MNPLLRPVRSLLPLAMTALLAVAACGGDDDDADPTTVPTGATTAEVTESTPASATTEPTTTEPATTEPATTEPATTEPAATDATAAPAAPAAVAYTSPEGDFSATFPGQPQTQTQSAPLPDGSVIDLAITGVELNGVFVATARGQYPDTYVLDVPQALQGAQDQAIANVQGTLIASQDVSLQGRPGREFSAAVTSNGVAGTVLQRVYLDGLVIYQNLAAGAGTLTFEDPGLAPFFASFAFTTG